VVRLHDLVSGDKRWETTIPKEISRTAIRPLQGYAASSGTVFAQAYSPDGDGPPILLGIDVEAGEVRWTSEPPTQDGEGIWGIVGDSVLLRSTSNSDNTVIRAVSHQTGDELWRFSNSTDISAYTVIGNVAIKDSNNTFTAYDLESGEQLWEVSPAVGNTPRSFGRGGRLYVGGGNREDGEFVTKVYNMDGELLWEKTGIITVRATSQALFGYIGDFDNFQMGMLVEE
jgi:outer membrane protein assembly factor BamB